VGNVASAQLGLFRWPSTILTSARTTSKDNSAVFPHQRHSVPTISEREELGVLREVVVEERQTMNAQELRAVVLHSSQRGLMIRQVLESLSQVMDQIQIQQLLLLARSNLMAMDEVSDGAGASEGGTLAEEVAESVLAEDQGEVHDFEGNLDDD